MFGMFRLCQKIGINTKERKSLTQPKAVEFLPTVTGTHETPMSNNSDWDT
jgi:hypothetical protein